MFHSYFDRKNIKVLTFNIVHFPNFEINASLGGGGGGRTKPPITGIPFVNLPNLSLPNQ